MDASSSFLVNSTNSTEPFDPYCAESTTSLVVIFIASALAVFVGLPACLWLLWVLHHRPHTCSSNDLYILQITSLELVLNISLLATAINNYVVQLQWLLDLCWVAGSLPMTGQPLFMACVCVDHYLAVVHPIVYMRVKKTRYRLAVCAVLWPFILALTVVFTVDKNAALTILWPICPVIVSPVILFTDVCILRMLTRPDPSGRGTVHPQKQRAIQAIVNSLVMIALSYAPPGIGLVISTAMGLSLPQYLCNISIPVSIFTVICCATIPLLHLHNLGKLSTIRCV